MRRLALTAVRRLRCIRVPFPSSDRWGGVRNVSTNAIRGPIIYWQSSFYRALRSSSSSVSGAIRASVSPHRTVCPNAHRLPEIDSPCGGVLARCSQLASRHPPLKLAFYVHMTTLRFGAPLPHGRAIWPCGVRFVAHVLFFGHACRIPHRCTSAIHSVSVTSGTTCAVLSSLCALQFCSPSNFHRHAHPIGIAIRSSFGLANSPSSLLPRVNPALDSSASHSPHFFSPATSRKHLDWIGIRGVSPCLLSAPFLFLIPLPRPRLFAFLSNFTDTIHLRIPFGTVLSNVRFYVLSL